MANLLVPSFNVGTELSQVIILASNGVSLSANALGHLEDISAEQNVTKKTITPVLYAGKRMHRNIYHDFSGSMMFSRFNGDITNLINGIMSEFQSTMKETYFSIYMLVNNTSVGTIDEYVFQNCILDGHKIGPFTGTDEVKAPLNFQAQSFIIAGSPASVLTAGTTIPNN